MATLDNTYRPGRGVGHSKEIDKLYNPADDIMILFDGTWCGKSTGTTGNVKILADAFSNFGATGHLKPIPQAKDENGDAVYEKRGKVAGREVYVRYFEGPGLEGTLEDYIVNGILAMDVKQHASKVYQTIIRRYKEGSRVWLFGLSRGAFIVRSVAAMINNVGILRKLDISGSNISIDEQIGFDKGVLEKLRLACDGVYDIYANPDPLYHPKSTWSDNFRDNRSWPQGSNPPIHFMGLFDTVGALGIPQLQSGIHLGYAFYDQNISTEVKTVVQALAMTDRLALFEPCYVRRKSPDPNYRTEEVWFSGSHYDIGRQQFVFLRKFVGALNPTTPRFSLKQLINIVDRGAEAAFRWVLGNLHVFEVDYTPELSNPPLQYMISRVQRADSELLRAESERLRAESDLPRAESELLRAESERLRAECELLRAESERLRAETELPPGSELLRAESGQELPLSERIAATGGAPAADDSGAVITTTVNPVRTSATAAIMSDTTTNTKELLPCPTAEYLAAFANNPWTFPRCLAKHFWLCYDIDAYDAIYAHWRAWPFIGTFFNSFINDQVLADRSIPLYRSTPTAFADNPLIGQMYKSKALNRYNALGGKGKPTELDSILAAWLDSVSNPDEPPGAEGNQGAQDGGSGAEGNQGALDEAPGGSPRADAEGNQGAQDGGSDAEGNQGAQEEKKIE